MNKNEVFFFKSHITRCIYVIMHNCMQSVSILLLLLLEKRRLGEDCEAFGLQGTGLRPVLKTFQVQPGSRQFRLDTNELGTSSEPS